MLRRLCVSTTNLSPSLGLCITRLSLTIVVSMESNTPHIVPVSEYMDWRVIVKTIGSSQQSKVLMYCCSSVGLRLMMSAMWLEPVEWALHCWWVVIELTKSYIAWVANITSEPVSFVVMIENPFSGMPTTCWTVASWRYRVGASQSSSDCRLFVGAMFASILTTCSHSTEEREVLEKFKFSTLFALFSLSCFVGFLDLMFN